MIKKEIPMSAKILLRSEEISFKELAGRKLAKFLEKKGRNEETRKI